jgi:integrase
MYQSEMKEGFFDSYLRSRVIQKTSLYGLFRKVEPYERQLNKDVSRFTKQEAITMYQNLKSRSVYTLLNNNSILKSYCAWLKYYHGLNTEIAYESITIEDLKPCVDQKASKLLSRDEVIDIENELLNYTDSAIVECLFQGIAGPSMRDITDLNVNMLDKDNRCLIFPDGRIFDITDRLCELLEKAFQEDAYICYGETLRVKQLIGRGKLFKERDNVHAADSDDRRFRAVYRKIQVIREYVGIKELTMKGIAASGMAFYLKQNLNKTDLGLKEFLQTDMGQKLMDRYGYQSEFRIDNVVHRFKSFI